MPVYMYKAVTQSGQIVRNRVEDVSRQNLIKKLRNNGLLPISVTQSGYNRSKKKNKNVKRRNVNEIEDVLKNANTANIGRVRTKRSLSLIERINLTFARQEKITLRDVVIFTQNFYLLKKANFNNIHALSTIIESTENLSFRGILEDILAGVEAGENMYTTMEYYSNVFPYIYVNMIKVGELSGSLTNSLKQAVKYLDDTTRINRKLRSIIIPNLVQFIMLLVLLIVGSIVAIPAIQNVFTSMGSTEQLPAISLWFSNVINNLVKYWYVPVIIIAIIAIAIILYIRTPKGKYNYHYFKYTMPIFGKLIYAIDFSRLMRAMLLNLQNGMRIQDALEVSKNVCQNYVMLSIVETSINNILIGQSWIEPFEKANLSSSMEVEMLKIGMQTDLSEMMEKLLEYMDIDINNKMDKIMKVLPELVYAIVGVVLIFFVIVVLVPCIQVYMGTFLFSAAGV
ncbi:MAG: type II secretion system F family protein [Clostridia bacterium]